MNHPERQKGKTQSEAGLLLAALITAGGMEGDIEGFFEYLEREISSPPAEAHEDAPEQPAPSEA